jgi:hypothetical protein
MPRSRAEAVSNSARAILSLVLRILSGPPKRRALDIFFMRIAPHVGFPTRSMTHTDPGYLVARVIRAMPQLCSSLEPRRRGGGREAEEDWGARAATDNRASLGCHTVATH